MNTTDCIGRAAAALIVGAACLFTSGCQSIEDAVKHAKRPPPPDTAPLEQGTAPERDARRADDDLLTLVAEKSRENQALSRRIAKLEKTAADSRKEMIAARQGEAKAANDAIRLQGLLDGALAREKSLQERLLQVELKAVRLEQDLYRQRLESLSSKTAKED